MTYKKGEERLKRLLWAKLLTMEEFRVSLGKYQAKRLQNYLNRTMKNYTTGRDETSTHILEQRAK